MSLLRSLTLYVRKRANAPRPTSERSKTALVNASLSGGAQKDKAASLADIKKIFGLDDDDSEDEGL